MQWRIQEQAMKKALAAQQERNFRMNRRSLSPPMGVSAGPLIIDGVRQSRIVEIGMVDTVETCLASELCVTFLPELVRSWTR